MKRIEAIIVSQVAIILATILSVGCLFISLYFTIITGEVSRLLLLGIVLPSMEIGAVGMLGFLVMPKK